MTPDPFKLRIHVRVAPDKTACGRSPVAVNFVQPHLAQHATCKTCIKVLSR